MIWYYYTAFIDLILFHVSCQLAFSLLGIETLVTTLLITNQLFSLNIKFLNPKWKLRIFILMILLNLIFCFNFYTFFRDIPSLNLRFSDQITDVIRRLPGLWITFAMIWDCVPVVIIALMLTATQLRQTKLNSVVDRKFNLILGIQVLIICSYFIVEFLKYYTLYLTSDRGSLFAGHIRFTLHGIHGLCSGILIERLQYFVPKVIGVKDSAITSRVTQ
ncbi:hypothetical protein BC833DRAFT_571040 [Globomyces pollinis-pini]|nr:hypothetical protein BC833DRAFT_571040 [Globomyces pollinis-pini]